MGARSSSISVFGATGRTGLLLLQQALGSGYKVTAFVRNPSKLGDFRERVTVVEGSVTDSDAVGRAISGCDAVLNTLGHVRDSPPDLLASSMTTVAEVMRKQGAKRLIVLANTAISDPEDRPPLAHKIIRGALRVGKRAVWRDSLREAEVIRGSGLDWTIVRAALLTDTPFTGRYKAGPLAKGMPLRASRADIAHFMLSCVTSGEYVRRMPLVGGGG